MQACLLYIVINCDIKGSKNEQNMQRPGEEN